MRLKQRIYEILEPINQKDPLAKAWSIVIVVLILVNVLGLMIGTIGSVQITFGPALRALEIFSVAVFAIEYVARLWTIAASPDYSHPFLGRLRYAITPAGTR